MKTIKQYTTPMFKLVRQDEFNKVFFVASGAPATTGGISTMTVNTSTTW